ncbi:MAG: hypothetical protein ACM3TR_04315 [Caulobacteraceae bacterium]
MRRKRKHSDEESIFEQIGLVDLKLHIGDKLYKNGTFYAEVKGESDALYFLQKANSSCDMPTPYLKDTVIENILFGKFIIERLSFQ